MNNKKSPWLSAVTCFMIALYVTGAPIMAYVTDDPAPIWMGFLVLVSVLFVILGALTIREGLQDKKLRAAEQQKPVIAETSLDWITPRNDPGLFEAGTRAPGLYTKPGAALPAPRGTKEDLVTRHIMHPDDK